MSHHFKPSRDIAFVRTSSRDAAALFYDAVLWALHSYLIAAGFWARLPAHGCMSFCASMDSLRAQFAVISGSRWSGVRSQYKQVHVALVG